MMSSRSEEQDLLAQTVRSLLAKRSDSLAVRAATETEAGFDTSLWQAMCEQVGVAALAIPEEYDGFGASLVETAIVLEELGYALTPSPLLATALASTAVLVHGPQDVRSDVLPRLAAGTIGTVVTDASLVLDGAAASILIGAGGRPITAAARPRPAMDTTLRYAALDLTGDAEPLEAPDVELVGAAMVTALQVGAMQRGLDMTVQHAKERVQFGRPIGSFQALKHRMADMLVLLEASRSASWAAASAAAEYVAEPGASCAESLHHYAHVAKAYCGDALDHIAAETVQLHGGVAITWEHDAQMVFKRAHALGQLFGVAHRHRAVVALTS